MCFTHISQTTLEGGYLITPFFINELRLKRAERFTKITQLLNDRSVFFLTRRDCRRVRVDHFIFPGWKNASLRFSFPMIQVRSGGRGWGGVVRIAAKFPKLGPRLLESCGMHRSCPINRPWYLERPLSAGWSQTKQAYVSPRPPHAPRTLLWNSTPW